MTFQPPLPLSLGVYFGEICIGPATNCRARFLLLYTSLSNKYTTWVCTENAAQTSDSPAQTRVPSTPYFSTKAAIVVSSALQKFRTDGRGHLRSMASGVAAWFGGPRSSAVIPVHRRAALSFHESGKGGRGGGQGVKFSGRWKPIVGRARKRACLHASARHRLAQGRSSSVVCRWSAHPLLHIGLCLCRMEASEGKKTETVPYAR